MATLKEEELNKIAPVLLPIIRRVLPSVLASSIVGVQPMTSPLVNIFVNPPECPICSAKECPLFEEYGKLITYFVPWDNSLHRNYYINISLQSKLIQVLDFNENILVQFYWNTREYTDYYDVRPKHKQSYDRETTKNLKDRILKLDGSEALADHGIIFENTYLKTLEKLQSK